MTELSQEEKAHLQKLAEDTYATVRIAMFWWPLLILWGYFISFLGRKV